MDLDKLTFALKNATSKDRKIIEQSISHLNAIVHLIIDKVQPEEGCSTFEQIISDKNNATNILCPPNLSLDDNFSSHLLCGDHTQQTEIQNEMVVQENPAPKSGHNKPPPLKPNDHSTLNYFTYKQSMSNNNMCAPTPSMDFNFSPYLLHDGRQQQVQTKTVDVCPGTDPSIQSSPSYDQSSMYSSQMNINFDNFEEPRVYITQSTEVRPTQLVQQVAQENPATKSGHNDPPPLKTNDHSVLMNDCTSKQLMTDKDNVENNQCALTSILDADFSLFSLYGGRTQQVQTINKMVVASSSIYEPQIDTTFDNYGEPTASNTTYVPPMNSSYELLEQVPPKKDSTPKPICNDQSKSKKNSHPLEPMGLHNYLYNLFDRWTDLCPESETLNHSINNHCEQPMIDSCCSSLTNNNNEKALNDCTSKQLMTDEDNVENNQTPILDADYSPFSLYGGRTQQVQTMNKMVVAASSIYEPQIDTTFGNYGEPTAPNTTCIPPMNNLPGSSNELLEQVPSKKYSTPKPICNDSPPSKKNSQPGDEILSTNANIFKTITQIVSPEVDPNIQLTAIHNSTNFFDQNGYIYSINNNNPKLKSCYFRCKHSGGSIDCPARATAKNKNLKQVKLTIQHKNHLPEQTVLSKTKFDTKLNAICEANKYMSTRDLYFLAREEVHNDEVPFIPLRTSYGSFIHRRKTSYKPKAPKTIDEFEQLINDEKFKKRYCFDQRNLTFYRGVWTAKNGYKMVVFVSETGLQYLMKLKVIELLMDGTFKVLPRHIKFSQLYIISFAFEEQCYPFAFIFMEKRDTEAYDLLFEGLVSMMGQECAEKVELCMSDYEAAVRNMIRKHFPKARVSGCYFHYVKAINKQSKRHGLTKQKEFQQPIRELCALALLPQNYVTEGFDLIDSRIEETAQWIRFKNYWNRQWLPANISVYGLRNRSDNFSESFNRSFNLLNGKPHQNIWIVLKNLKRMEMDKTDQLLKHYPGKMMKKSTNTISVNLNKKILEATNRFNETEDVQRFLENITHDEQIQKACKQSHLLEDDDDDVDNEEMFLPNDFDKNSIFEKIQKPQLKRKAAEDLKETKKPRMERKGKEKIKQIPSFKIALFRTAPKLNN